jgi:multiple sugar transport system ATP-binding protein
MSVYENMAFALKLAKTPQAEIDAAVRAAAAVLDLERVLDRKPKALSGGQRQRAAIGRAIVRKPELFLFDEPLSNLDAGLRVRMRYELARLHGRLKTTMIYVTPDQVEAMTLADRIVVLSEGRVEQVGAPMEVYRSPENLFVAGFIGSPRMNFLAVKLVEAAPARAKVRLGPQVLTAAVDARGTPPGSKVTLGVRPEHFHAGAGADAQSLTVRFVESLGGVLYAYGAEPGTEEALVVQLPGDSSVSAGQALAVRIDPASAHLFAPEGRAYARASAAAPVAAGAAAGRTA